MNKKEFKVGEKVTCEIPIKQWNYKKIIVEAKVKSIREVFGRKIFTLTKGRVINDIDVSNIGD